MKYDILEPNGKAIAKDIKVNKLFIRTIFMLLNSTQNKIQLLESLSFYQKSALRKDFEPVFGKPHGFMDGKYKKSAIYVFNEKNTNFLCIIEPGDRGTGWYLVGNNLSNSFQPIYMDDDSISDKFISLISKINYEIKGQHLPLGDLPEKAKQEILSILSNEEKEKLSDKIKKTNRPNKAYTSKKI